jgi:dipeptidyl aminopeptidase/acylaminoacyl peptidase
MTSPRRFEQDLPVLLADLYLAGTPDYRDDLVRQVALVRQRPAWTFPERWIPMAVVTRRPVLAPNVPWRALGTLALLGLLIAAAVAAFVGSQPRLPNPFGPARNGLITYAANGDIFTADPVTGMETVIVSGPDNDVAPRFSRDGTHIVFERRPTVIGPGRLYVARSDGSAIVQVTPEALANIESYAFSPSGGEILIHAGLALHVANADGSGMRTLPIEGLIASDPDYSAPDGAEIVFVGETMGATATGLYAVRPDGTGLRTIVEPANLVMIAPRWSPDGSRIAYSAYAVDYETGGSLLRAYVVTADGVSNRLLRVLPENDLENATDWSNDGTRLLIEGCYADPADGTAECVTAYSVVPVDGNGSAAELDVPAAYRAAENTWHVWAPDDGTILTVPVDFAGIPTSTPLLWDPLTGRSRAWPGPTAGRPSWQRLAP